VIYWLLYRKGSFWLKEKFSSRDAAEERGALLASSVCFIAIHSDDKPAIVKMLAGALEVDHLAGCFIFGITRPNSVAVIVQPASSPSGN
jgi:hypothetical protein